MASQLNIKDGETVQIVKDYATELGRSVTATVRIAVENDRRAHHAAIAEKIRRANEIVEDFQRRLPEEWKGKSSRQIMDSIYDDDEPDGFAR